MATAQQPKTGRLGKPPRAAALKVAAYDRAASLLIALLIVIGVVVFCLFVIWISSQIFVGQQAVPVIMDNLGGGREDGVLGESLKIESPDPRQIAQESELVEPQLQETVALVLDAVATVQANLDDPALTEELESGGKGSSQGTGDQVGLGAGDGPGAGFPRAQRWVIQFDGGSLDSYAAQLDYFGIELAAIGNTNQIHYAHNLGKPRPDRRTGRADEEKRLYFSWRDGTLKKADEELLTRAGVPTAGKILVQFYPAETENQLAYLEQQYARRDAAEIRRTRFGVRSKRGGYEFYVIDQSYLR